MWSEADISQSNGDKPGTRDHALAALGLSGWVGGRLSRRRAKKRHPLDCLQWIFISAVSDSARDKTRTSTARSILTFSTATKRSPGCVAAGQRAHRRREGSGRRVPRSHGAERTRSREDQGPAISKHTLPRLRNQTSPHHRPIPPTPPTPRPCFAPRHANWRVARGCL